MRPITARIHLAAFRHNLGVVRRHAPKSRIWAVVKADAYGHGLKRAARALEADGLALLELEGALALRSGGERRPILLLEGFFSPRELPQIAENDLDARGAQPRAGGHARARPARRAAQRLPEDEHRHESPRARRRRTSAPRSRGCAIAARSRTSRR